MPFVKTHHSAWYKAFCLHSLPAALCLSLLHDILSYDYQLMVSTLELIHLTVINTTAPIGNLCVNIVLLS